MSHIALISLVLSRNIKLNNYLRLTLGCTVIGVLMTVMLNTSVFLWDFCLPPSNVLFFSSISKFGHKLVLPAVGSGIEFT